MAKAATNNTLTLIGEDTTIEQDRAITKIAEGLVELGIPTAEALDEAEDFLVYAKISQHFDAAAAF